MEKKESIQSREKRIFFYSLCTLCCNNGVMQKRERKKKLNTCLSFRQIHILCYQSQSLIHRVSQPYHNSNRCSIDLCMQQRYSCEICWLLFVLVHFVFNFCQLVRLLFGCLQSIEHCVVQSRIGVYTRYVVSDGKNGTVNIFEIAHNKILHAKHLKLVKWRISLEYHSNMNLWSASRSTTEVQKSLNTISI